MAIRFDPHSYATGGTRLGPTVVSGTVPPLITPQAQAISGLRKDIRWPGNAAIFEVWTDDQQVALRDFSLRGLGIILPHGRGGADGLELELRHARRRFARLSLEVMHVTASAAGDIVGGRILSSLPLATGAESPGMGDSIEVRESSQCEAILRRLETSTQPGVLYTADGRRSAATIKVVALSEGLQLSLGAAGRLVEGPATLEALLSDSAFRIQGRIAVGHDGAVLRKLRILSVGRRQHERVRHWEQRPTLSWRHPLDPSYWVSAPVEDLSPKGASVRLRSDLTLLMAPPPATLLLNLGHVQLPVLAEVRHSAAVGADAVHVGLRIEPQAPNDAILLTRACQTARFPMLSPRGHAVPTAVDDLLRASGYLALRERTTPAPGWHAPSAGEELTVDLIHRGATGKPVGHGSYLRIYPKTWLFHQLATVGLRRASIAFPLYAQASEWALSLTEQNVFALSYFDQSKSWHRAMLRDFLSWVGSDALSTIAPLDRLERVSGMPDEHRLDEPRVKVREATAADRGFIAELARCYLPPLVADALHIFEATVHQKELCGQHAAAGLERSRTALVVEVDGRLEAAALCETGSRTLSLFNILNMAHVFVKRTTAPQLARPIQVNLLRAVLEFYQARGVLDPLIVAPQGTLTSHEAVGLTVTETMGCWVASREGLKQWKNYTHFALGSLFERTHARRGSQSRSFVER